jgi:hypothetical protein
MKQTRHKQAKPGTVIDARGITLSAGVAAFDEALVKRFKEIAKAPAEAEQIESEWFGEEGPVVGPAAVELPLAQPHQHGDDTV